MGYNAISSLSQVYFIPPCIYSNKCWTFTPETDCPSLYLCLLLLSKEHFWEEQRICLAHPWWNPPISNKGLLTTYLWWHGHGQVLTEAHCSSLQFSFAAGQGVGPRKVLTLEKVLLSLFFPPFLNSCSLVERRSQNTHLYQCPRVTIQSTTTPGWPKKEIYCLTSSRG